MSRLRKTERTSSFLPLAISTFTLICCNRDESDFEIERKRERDRERDR